MYIQYSHKKIDWLLNGRREKGKKWIPSLLNFNRKNIWLNDVARYKKCPFAAEHIYKTEKYVDKVTALVRNSYDSIVARNKDVLLQVENKKIKTYSLAGYSKVSCILAEAICRYEYVLNEHYRGIKAGIVRYDEASVVNKTIDNAIRKAKTKPFAYNDRDITTFEYEGTIEWKACVKDLGHEPLNIPYKPKYFLMH